MAAKSRRPRKKPTYIFVDTNIFLDFYRGNNEATLGLLEKLRSVKESIISTYQVEMEFKNNRQKVIKETLSSISFEPKVSLPAVFRDSATGKSLANLKGDAKKKLGIVKRRFLKLLKNPKSTDNVFQALEDIFHNPSSHVLTRNMDVRHSVKRLAWRRFILGYPPRKKNDTSIGDALNWEWVIHCGQTLTGSIIIVSRDNDYGCTIDGNSFLNDHLIQEYSERVGPRRPIELTDKLSVALKRLDVAVTDEELTAESEQLAEEPSPTVDTLSETQDAAFKKAMVKYFVTHAAKK